MTSNLEVEAGENEWPPPPSSAREMRAHSSVLAMVRFQDQAHPLLPIRPLNSTAYTGLILGIGQARLYELITEGIETPSGRVKLDVRKLGHLTKITGASIMQLIDALPRGVDMKISRRATALRKSKKQI